MWKSYITRENCENFLEVFLNSIYEGFALHEIIYDNIKNPVDYKFLEVNNVFLNMTGLKREDIIGVQAAKIIPSLGYFWAETYGKIALSGEAAQFESYSAELDKYFNISVFSPVKGQFITFFNDITKLKKSAEVSTKHQILFENAKDIILYTKFDGSIVDSNKNATIKYGYSYDELTKMNIQDIRHKDTSGVFQSQMERADAEGITFECIHVKKDGTSFPVEVSASSVIIGSEKLRIHIIRDISERKANEDKIMYLANYDSLTGIPNRNFLMRQLDEIIKQAHREKYKFALALFDIDKFKRINDVYGHSVGDIVLKETAQRVKSSIRATDFLGRLGGDEFIIIFSYIKNIEDIAVSAGRILENLKHPLKLDIGELPVSISMGISVYPDDTDDKDTLMKYSDDAMYTAKQNGGNKWQLYDLQLVCDS